MALDFNPSHREHATSADVEASLRAGRLDPKFLYASDRLAALWRQVFLKHSPIHRNPEFARIYRDAFQSAAESMSAQTIWLLGLGAGTGLKEAELTASILKSQCEVIFSAVDVSADLVLEAMETMGEVPGHSIWGDALVTDLADIDFLKKWLDYCEINARRIYTFFGLVPNFAPSIVINLFRSILRPGDVVLCSAHLAPVNERTDLRTAMERVLPQYDNTETLEWLKAALDECGLSQRLSNPVMTIGETEGIPAFLGRAEWKPEEIFAARAYGEAHPEMDRPLEVFRSLRYTPAMFETVLQREGFQFERLALTACGEEGIWAVRV